MWRQEDIFFALCGGIDAYTNEKHRVVPRPCATASPRARARR